MAMVKVKIILTSSDRVLRVPSVNVEDSEFGPVELNLLIAIALCSMNASMGSFLTRH